MSPDQIAALKEQHPAFFAERRALFPGVNGDLHIATVLVQQLAADAANPPEARAFQRVKAAKEIVTVHIERARLAHENFEKALAEVRAEYPDVLFEVVELPFTGDDDSDEVADLNRLLDEHRDLVARNAERIKELEAELAVKDERISQITDELGAYSEACTSQAQVVEKLEADLKASQEALSAKSKKK